MEAYDIFGNIIPDEAPPVPVVAPVVPEPVAEVVPAPAKVKRTRTAKPPIGEVPVTPPEPVLQKLPWSPYTDLSIYNPALLPAVVRNRIKSGGDFIFNKLNNSPVTNHVLVNEMFQLGLNPESRADCQIFADLRSVFRPDDDLEVKRRIFFNESPIRIENDLFKTNKVKTPAGTGFAMVARQLAAAQEIAKRTGKDVNIKVHAVSWESGVYTGFSVWPKLGYNFPVPNSIQQKLKEMGFAAKDIKETTTLMMAKNAKGQTGFDVWRGLTEGKSLDGYGNTVVSAQGYLSPAQEVTKEYGKRSGFVKSATQPSDIFSGGQLSASDDDALRQAWLSVSKGK
jgi:hypothetical protein